MNKKSVIISVVAVALIIALLGCFETMKPQQENKGEPYLYFADSENEIITLYEKPKRVAVLFSSLCNVWQLAGGETAISVEESVERELCPSDVLLVSSGAGKTIDTELLISYEPDLVIYSPDVEAQKQCAELLSKQNINCVALRLDSFKDYLNALKICTAITGETENYNTYGSSIEKEIESICEQNKELHGKEILFIRSGSSAQSAKAKKAEDNFAAKMLEELGCVNIADSAEILLDTLSIEEIIERDPEYIFVSLMGDENASKEYMNSLLQSDAWQTLSAVKEQKVYFLPKDLFQYKPCENWAKAYKYLSDILYS